MGDGHPGGGGGRLIAKNHSGRAVRPARYVPSVAIFAWNQDHIGLDVSPIAASTPSPIFSWRCSRFHERSEREISLGRMQSNQNENVHRCLLIRLGMQQNADDATLIERVGVGDRLTAIIIPLNAERPRNLRRAFGTAPEEWPGQKLVRSSA